MPKKLTGVAGESVTYSIPDPAGGVKLETFIPWTLVKRGLKKQVITPIDAPEHFREEAAQEKQIKQSQQDSPLLRALGLAHYWESLLDEGKYRSISEIAAAEGMDLGRASRIARMTQLAPDIVEAFMEAGKNEVTLERLNRYSLPVDWVVQRRKFRTVGLR